jgi:ribosomal protein L40E
MFRRRSKNPLENSLFCGKCGASLPEGSQFCLRCGQAVEVLGASPAPVTGPALVSCAECGAEFPAREQFCLMCGQSVHAMPKGPQAKVETSVRGPSQAAVPKRRKSPILIWLLLPALALGIWWAAASDNPAALQLRRLANESHTQTITPAVFSLKPRGFASYEFTVPSGSVGVVVSGEFTATGGSSSDIEVYVLKDDAFVNWQYGYAPSAYYSSSRVIKGDINAELPAGAGTYYVVFNNNFSPRTTKSVQSEVTLHYTKFWPQF